jgi:hypothetical protein
MKTFTQTSDEPYNRHHYKVVFTDGREVVFDNYADVQQLWYNNPKEMFSHVEVLDIKPMKRDKKKKGF